MAHTPQKQSVRLGKWHSASWLDRLPLPFFFLPHFQRVRQGQAACSVLLWLLPLERWGQDELCGEGDKEAQGRGNGEMVQGKMRFALTSLCKVPIVQKH